MPSLPIKREDIERMKSSLIGLAYNVINLAANYVWTGLHTFQNIITTHEIYPETNAIYDIGSASKRYRTIHAAELAATLFSKDEIMIVGNKLIAGKNQGTLAADVTSGATQVDFGQSMTTNDWIMIMAEDSVSGSPGLEWMLIGSLVSGTTYNVTRNVDGSGANAWAAGTPYLVVGKNGDFRIEMTAGSASSIRLIKQGSAWNLYRIENSIDNNGFSALVAPDEITDLNAYKLISETDGATIVSLWGKNVTSGRAGHYSGITVHSPTGFANYIEIIEAPISNKSASFDRTLKDNTGSYNILHNELLGGTLTSYWTDANLIFHPTHHSDVLGPFLSFPGLRACWYGLGYEGTAGAYVMPDRSGMRHHLSTSGTPPTATITGTGYSGVTYVGLTAASSQYMYRANETNFNTQNLTQIVLWVYFTSLPTSGHAMSIVKNGDTTEAWQLYVNNISGTIRFNFRTYDSGGSATTITPTFTPATDTWYFLLGAVPYVGFSQTQRLGINGTIYTTTMTNSARTPSGNFTIGTSSGGSYLDGRIGPVLYSIGSSDDSVSYKALFESTRYYFGA